MKVLDFELGGVKYKVDKPTLKDRQDAKRQYNVAFRSALSDGAWFREAAMRVAKEHGVWTDEDEARLAELYKQIDELTKKLEEGGYEVDAALEDARRMSQLRTDILRLNIKLSPIYARSAEAQAEEMESSYLVFACLKNSKGQKYCSTFDDFLNKKDEEDPVILHAMSGGELDFDYWNNLPEVKFLKEYGPDESEVPVKEKVETKPFTKNGKAVKPK